MEAVFFPRKDYNVEVCAHRYGKAMTYTDQTDQLKLTTSYDWFVATAKARDIKIGFFAYYNEPLSPNFGKALDDLYSGAIWIDQYSWAPEFKDKIVAHENITPEEFRTAYLNSLLPPFYSAIGYKPLALSYSYGNYTFKDAVCPLYLGARNSGDEDCDGTDYGYGYGTPSNVPYSQAVFCNQPSSYRWYDRGRTLISGGMDIDTAFDTVIGNVRTAITATKANHGWFRNFTHFHSVTDDGNERYAELYYDMLAEENIDGDIYFAGYGEALAYLVYRQMITRAVMYAPKMYADTLIIRLETKNTDGVDTSLLRIPISIKFSTVGTTLAGAEITSDCNLINLGGGDYIVEIPFGRFPSAVITRVNS